MLLGCSWPAPSWCLPYCGPYGMSRTDSCLYYYVIARQAQGKAHTGRIKEGRKGTDMQSKVPPPKDWWSHRAGRNCVRATDTDPCVERFSLALPPFCPKEVRLFGPFETPRPRTQATLVCLGPAILLARSPLPGQSLHQLEVVPRPSNRDFFYHVTMLLIKDGKSSNCSPEPKNGPFCPGRLSWKNLSQTRGEKGLDNTWILHMQPSNKRGPCEVDG